MSCHDCGRMLSISEATNLHGFCIECDSAAESSTGDIILTVMCFGPALLLFAYLIVRLVIA